MTELKDEILEFLNKDENFKIVLFLFLFRDTEVILTLNLEDRVDYNFFSLILAELFFTRDITLKLLFNKMLNIYTEISDKDKRYFKKYTEINIKNKEVDKDIKKEFFKFFGEFHKKNMEKIGNQKSFLFLQRIEFILLMDNIKKYIQNREEKIKKSKKQNKEILKKLNIFKKIYIKWSIYSSLYYMFSNNINWKEINIKNIDSFFKYSKDIVYKIFSKKELQDFLEKIKSGNFKNQLYFLVIDGDKLYNFFHTKIDNYFKEKDYNINLVINALHLYYNLLEYNKKLKLIREEVKRFYDKKEKGNKQTNIDVNDIDESNNIKGDIIYDF